MTPPTPDELKALEATLEKNIRTWKAQPAYCRTLEVELYSVRRLIVDMPL